jgi:hypothetical protein
MKHAALRTSNINEFTTSLDECVEAGYTVISSGLAGGQHKVWWAVLVMDGPE